MKLVPLLLFLVPTLLAQADGFGLPACSGADREFADRSYFVLCSQRDGEGARMGRL